MPFWADCERLCHPRSFPRKAGTQSRQNEGRLMRDPGSPLFAGMNGICVRVPVTRNEISRLLSDEPGARPPAISPARPPCIAGSWIGWRVPAIPEFERRSPPPSSRCVANECRKACGVACSGSPFSRRKCRNVRCATAGLRRPPRAPVKSGAAGCGSGCKRSHAATLCRTTGRTGTRRSLEPLPTTLSAAVDPGSGASRTSSASASAIRRPQPYSKVNSAVSRAWMNDFSDTSPISRATARACAGAKALGSGGLARGAESRVSAGFRTPCRRAR